MLLHCWNIVYAVFPPGKTKSGGGGGGGNLAGVTASVRTTLVHCAEGASEKFCGI